MTLPQPDPDPAAALARSAVGAMFFSLFGGLWVAAWCVQTYGAHPLRLLPVAGITVLLCMLAWRQFRRHRAAHAAAEQSPQAKRAGRLFNIVNAGQWIAIFIVGNVLKNMGLQAWFIPAVILIVGLQAWFIPAVILIVGLHFFPLAWLFKARRHVAIGMALCVWAIGYPFTVRHGPIHPVGCLGAGLILWVAALSAVRAGFAVQHNTLQAQK